MPHILLAAATFATLAAGAPAVAAEAGHTYIDGLAAGVAQGREEGRALQLGQMLAPADRPTAAAAFTAGYAAGSNDAFAGYDGGWGVGAPYVVTLAPGSGVITYRFDSRIPLAPNVNYYLCADGHSLCQEPRR